jgi:hypothetical protein
MEEEYMIQKKSSKKDLFIEELEEESELENAHYL